MDSAYQDKATRELARKPGFVPVVPPSARRRDEAERLFRRLKAWRRVFTRYDRTDVMLAALIAKALR